MNTTARTNKNKFARTSLIITITALAVICFSFTSFQQQGNEKWTTPSGNKDKIDVIKTIIYFKDRGRWVVPSDAYKLLNPIPLNNESISEGKKIYKRICKQCHGKNGDGEGAKSSELEKAPGNFTTANFKSETEGEIFWKISHGNWPMPSLKSELTKEQRWEVINYISVLTNAKSPNK